MSAHTPKRFEATYANNTLIKYKVAKFVPSTYCLRDTEGQQRPSIHASFLKTKQSLDTASVLLNN